MKAQGKHSTTPSSFKGYIYKCYFPHQDQWLALIPGIKSSLPPSVNVTKMWPSPTSSLLPPSYSLTPSASRALCHFYQHQLLLWASAHAVPFASSSKGSLPVPFRSQLKSHLSVHLSTHSMSASWGQNLSCSPLYPYCLEQSLARGRCLDECSVKEWRNLML